MTTPRRTLVGLLIAGVICVGAARHPALNLHNSRVPDAPTHSTGTRRKDLPQHWTPVRRGRVYLEGHALCDDDGPFLGLGASYFQALRHAKYDRARLNQQPGPLRLERLQLRAHSQHGQLGRSGDCAGDLHQPRRARGASLAGLLAAVPRPARPGCPARPARRGDHLCRCAIRDAHQRPGKPSGRHPGQHCRTRAPDPAPGGGERGLAERLSRRPGIADLREFAQYLADRTSVLVAITSNDDTSDRASFRSTAAARPIWPPSISAATPGRPEGAGCRCATLTGRGTCRACRR